MRLTSTSRDLTPCDRSIESQEARLVLRWAAEILSPLERLVVLMWLDEVPERETARQIGMTRGGVWMARRAAYRKMRQRLERAGIRGTCDLFSAPRDPAGRQSEALGHLQ